jgi:hypothetical protein
MRDAPESVHGLLQNLKFELLDHPISVPIKILSFSLWSLAIAVGSYAQFLLPSIYAGRSRSAECYFTDALIIYIECRDGPWAPLLNWAWLWTWGSWVTVSFAPLWLPVGLPAVVTLWFALSFAALLIRLRV